ncbi:hypothetical protein DPMN_126099 [Dreissena polymorpha]|uniref:Uncharacterized protein n=1 Tax=Dreissena polymorpha TaxID=45954 RepID=A0A9D4GV39_DREPO|nr:hypothetical protein DPMN_126099 [Dreissena polymorpha]
MRRTYPFGQVGPNVLTNSALTSKSAPSQPCFSRNCNPFLNVRRNTSITNYLTKFHEDWNEHVTSRVETSPPHAAINVLRKTDFFKRKTLTSRVKTAPPHRGQSFSTNTVLQPRFEKGIFECAVFCRKCSFERTVLFR